MVNSPAAMVPSIDRPIPLRARDDLIVTNVKFRGIDHWALKDPIGLKYDLLRREQYRLLQLLDGRRNLEQLRGILQAEFPGIHWTHHLIHRQITDLHSNRLVTAARFGQHAALDEARRKRRKKKILATLTNFLFLRLPGWDPTGLLDRLYPLVRWMYSRPAVIGAAAAFLFAWLWLGSHSQQVRNELPAFSQFFGWPNLLYLYLTLAVTKIIHEFGHGLSCRHYGAECHEMGVMLLVFAPALYCDASDSWMLPNKWHRIIIAAAGMYIESILFSIAVFVWWQTVPGLLHHLALNVMFVTSVSTILFNINPLMRLDGYYMLSDYLEIPNLQKTADTMTSQHLSRICFGIEPQPDPFLPETGRGVLTFYAFAARVYRLLIFAGITIFLYTFLKPYGLENLSFFPVLMLAVTLSLKSGAKLVRMIRAPREQKIKRRRLTFVALLATGVVVALCTGPLPIYIEAAFVIEPHDVQDVYTTVPGRLEEILVRPGDQVAPQQVLAVLSTPDKEDEERQLRNQIEVLDVEIRTHHAAGDSAAREESRARREGLRRRLEECRRQLAELKIKSPIAGTVVEPSVKEEPSLEAQRDRLSNWYGTPLEPANRFSTLAERTHLLSVAPDDKMQAVLLIDQADLARLQVGRWVNLKFDHLPNQVHPGVVDEISEHHEEFAPTPLSNKAGGSLSTVTDSSGREKLTATAYRATILLSEETRLLLPGLRGRARCIVAKESAVGFLWRTLRNLLHFRL